MRRGVRAVKRNQANFIALPMQTKPPVIFNERRTRLRRARAAKNFAAHAFLHERIADDIDDRLQSINRQFDTAIIDGMGPITTALLRSPKIQNAIIADSVADFLQPRTASFIMHPDALAIEDSSANAYISILRLHSVNDPVGAITQIKRVLKPDGLFIGAVFAEDTLKNFRSSLYRAESEIMGGVAGRFAPFATIQSLGQVLSRSGLALPVVDIDKVRVDYKNPLTLLRDIKGMGENLALNATPPPLRRSVLQQACEYFESDFGYDYFDIVYLTGWAPHADQQKPLKPGSAKASLADAVKKF